MFRSLLSPRRRRRPLAAAVAALVLAVTAAACDSGPPPPENPPYWLPGSAVTATLHGPLVRIQWDAPQGGDPVNAYQINLGTYDGAGVALVPASVRDCYISGLNASTAYTIVVTARDAQMHWSGPLPGTQGRRTTTITTSSHGDAGPNLWCHAAVDSDGDGLPNGVETNNGTFQGAGKTGTNPNLADTDNDGISDGAETLGRPGLNVIAMGARPTRKDLLIEADWISNATCVIRPTAAKLVPMIAPFADAPVVSPDGSDGINVIVDYGQGGPFTGGNQVPDPDGTLDGRFTGQGVSGARFAAAKAAHFAGVRKGIFHYVVIHNGNSGTSFESSAEMRGDDSYVSGGCHQGDPGFFVAELMHEMGHNLGLGHGGSEDLPGDPDGPFGPDRICDDPFDPSACVAKTAINWKPNYVSAMNYMYQSGIDDSCRDNDYAPHQPLPGPMRLDYSSGTRAPIDENALDERVGICNGIPFDFNNNGVIDPAPYAANITDDGGPTTILSPLHDHDDWGHINRVGLTKFTNDTD